MNVVRVEMIKDEMIWVLEKMGISPKPLEWTYPSFFHFQIQSKTPLLEKQHIDENINDGKLELIKLKFILVSYNG